MNQDPFGYLSAGPAEAPAGAAPPRGHAPLAPGAVAPWLREGARAALALPVRWQGLAAHPAVALVLVAMGFMLTLLLQRLYLQGPVRLFPAALLSGGLVVATMAWAAHLVRPADAQAPSGAQVFCLLAAQGLFINASCGGLFIVLLQAQVPMGEAHWALVSLAASGWMALSQWGLLRQSAPGRPGAAGLATAVLASARRMRAALRVGGRVWVARLSELARVAARRVMLREALATRARAAVGSPRASSM